MRTLAAYSLALKVFKISVSPSWTGDEAFPVEPQPEENRQPQAYKYLCCEAGVSQKIPVIIIVRWHVPFR